MKKFYTNTHIYLIQPIKFVFSNTYKVHIGLKIKTVVYNKNKEYKKYEKIKTK